MKNDGPMEHLDDWEESLAARYPAGASLPVSDRSTAGIAFRDYSPNVRPGIREFYRLNHRHQTVELHRCRRGVTRREFGAGGQPDALLHRCDAIADVSVENRPRQPRVAARTEVAVIAALDCER